MVYRLDASNLVQSHTNAPCRVATKHSPLPLPSLSTLYVYLWPFVSLICSAHAPWREAFRVSSLQQVSIHLFLYVLTLLRGFVEASNLTKHVSTRNHYQSALTLCRYELVSGTACSRSF